jgi:hypothetical protein
MDQNEIFVSPTQHNPIEVVLARRHNITALVHVYRIFELEIVVVYRITTQNDTIFFFFSNFLTVERQQFLLIC